MIRKISVSMFFIGVYTVILETGCMHKKLSNKFDDTKYDCGTSISADMQYVKIVELTGLEITDLSSTKATLNGAENSPKDLKITAKGCVVLPKNYDSQKQSITITRVDNSVSQAQVVRERDKTSNKVTLEKISPEVENLKCDKHLFLSGKLKLPTEFSKLVDDRYHWSAKLGATSATLAKNGEDFFQTDDIKEADYDVVFQVRDRYLNSTKDIICKATIDRSLPDLTIEGGVKEANTLKVEPGENLVLKINDQTPTQIFYCFGSSPSGCDWKQAQDFINSPASGQTHLFYYAVDSAGNKSSIADLYLVVWNRSLLDEIVRLAKQALMLESTAEARELTKKAKEKEESLLTIEEKSTVADLLKSSIFRSTNAAAEEFRIFGDAKAFYLQSIIVPHSKMVASIGKTSLWITDVTNGKRKSVDLGDNADDSDAILTSDFAGSTVVFGNRYQLKVSDSSFNAIKNVKLPVGAAVLAVQPTKDSVILALSNGQILSLSKAQENPAEVLSLGKKLWLAVISDEIFAAVDSENKILSGNWKNKNVSKVSVDLGKTTGNFKFMIPPKILSISKSILFASDGDKNSNYWLHSNGSLNEKIHPVVVAPNPTKVQILGDRSLFLAYGQRIEKRDLFDSTKVVLEATISDGIRTVIPTSQTVLVATKDRVYQFDSAFNRKTAFWTSISEINHVAITNDKILISGFSSDRASPYVSGVPVESDLFGENKSVHGKFYDATEDFIWHCDGVKLISKRVGKNQEVVYDNGCESEPQSIATFHGKTLIITSELSGNDDSSGEFSIGSESLALKIAGEGSKFIRIEMPGEELLSAKVLGSNVFAISASGKLVRYGITDQAIQKVDLPANRNFQIIEGPNGETVLSDSEKSFVYTKDLKLVKEYIGYVLALSDESVVIDNQTVQIDFSGKTFELKELKGRRIQSTLLVGKAAYLGLDSGHVVKVESDGKWEETRLSSRSIGSLYRLSGSIVAIAEDDAYVVNLKDFGRLPRRVNYLRVSADKALVSFDGLDDYLDLSLGR